MKNYVMKVLWLFSIVFICTLSISMAQEKNKTNSSNYKQKMQMAIKSAKTESDTSIVRKGLINLTAIDKNKDGKVYEDMMDYNVISDKPGKCPLCGMTLKKVTIKQAKSNLINAGFKVVK